jgi:hypothetical protein
MYSTRKGAIVRLFSNTPTYPELSFSCNSLHRVVSSESINHFRHLRRT